MSDLEIFQAISFDSQLAEADTQIISSLSFFFRQIRDVSKYIQEKSTQIIELINVVQKLNDIKLSYCNIATISADCLKVAKQLQKVLNELQSRENADKIERIWRDVVSTIKKTKIKALFQELNNWRNLLNIAMIAALAVKL